LSWSYGTACTSTVMPGLASWNFLIAAVPATASAGVQACHMVSRVALRADAATTGAAVGWGAVDAAPGSWLAAPPHALASMAASTSKLAPTKKLFFTPQLLLCCQEASETAILEGAQDRKTAIKWQTNFFFPHPSSGPVISGKILGDHGSTVPGLCQGCEKMIYNSNIFMILGQAGPRNDATRGCSPFAHPIRR